VAWEFECPEHVAGLIDVPAVPEGAAVGEGLGEAVASFMHLLAKAFSEQRWTIQRVLAGGRHRRPALHAQRPAHRRVPRVAGDRGVEHWAVRDDAALMRRLTGSRP